MPDNNGSWLVVDTATDIDTITVETAADARGGGRGVGLVRVFGDVDLDTQVAFEAALERVRAGEPCRIVLDCSAMAFCGVGGLAAVMRTVARGAEHGTDVAVVGLSPLLQRLCAQLWPGPQPVPCVNVTDAVLAVAPAGAAAPVEAA